MKELQEENPLMQQVGCDLVSSCGCYLVISAPNGVVIGQDGSRPAWDFCYLENTQTLVQRTETALFKVEYLTPSNEAQDGDTVVRLKKGVDTGQMPTPF